MNLTLHLTPRCNLRCRYCYAAPYSGAAMATGTIESAVEMADAITQRETPGWPVEIVFFGGEPLLRRELIAATVRRCRQIARETGQRFAFHMPTNGVLLDEALLTHPDTRDVAVALSIDGTRAAHDAQRVDAAGRGSWDAAVRAARLLLAHQPQATAQMVVTPFTARWYAASVAALHRMGFQSIHPTLDYGARWRPRHFRTLAHQYERLAEWYTGVYSSGRSVRFSPFDHKVYSALSPDGARSAGCHLARHQVSVAPDGAIYPCVQFVGRPQYAIGHVDTGLDEAARQRLGQSSTEGEAACRECAIRARCLSTCACQNIQATGRIDAVSPALCAHERIVLPIADRAAARLIDAGCRAFAAAFGADRLIAIGGRAPAA